jgi:hypothetical protein
MMNWMSVIVVGAVASGGFVAWVRTRDMRTYITIRIPIWFPCFISTLLAFSLSIKPSMTLPTLPAESGLRDFPPWLAILVLTGLGFAWGLVLSWVCKELAADDNTERHNPT